jgi:hypothetical protein
MTGVGLAALLRLVAPAMAAELPMAMPVKVLPISTEYDWTGFYLGAHLGYAGGSSNWTASSITAAVPNISGSLSLLQRFDPFNEAGSFFGGLQVGYDYMFPKPLCDRCRGRYIGSSLAQSRRNLHWRHLNVFRATDRRGKLQ